MDSLTRTGWVATLVKLLPGPVLKALDAWSYRVAQRRAQRRRELQRVAR